MMRCLRELPVLWQWGQGMTGCPQFVCMNTFLLIWRPDETNITRNQTWIHPPGPGFRDEPKEVTAQCKRSPHEVKPHPDSLQVQRAVCHYKYSIVQSAVNKSQRLIIRAAKSAWHTDSEVLNLNCSHFLKQTTIIHSDAINPKITE